MLMPMTTQYVCWPCHRAMWRYGGCDETGQWDCFIPLTLSRLWSCVWLPYLSHVPSIAEDTEIGIDAATCLGWHCPELAALWSNPTKAGYTVCTLPGLASLLLAATGCHSSPSVPGRWVGQHDTSETPWWFRMCVQDPDHIPPLPSSHLCNSLETLKSRLPCPLNSTSHNNTGSGKQAQYLHSKKKGSSLW